MATLHGCMSEMLKDWQGDLPQDGGWRDFFGECPGLAFDQIPLTVEVADGQNVWPGRRAAPIQGAPPGSHICRAFDNISCDDIRVVILGQDPYPSAACATGRAFEDGSWTGGRTEDLADSLKGLMLAALAARDGENKISFEANQWDKIRKEIEEGKIKFPPLDQHFDALENQGVLFLNGAWTHTREQDVEFHIGLWDPILKYFLTKIANAEQCVVFLLLGQHAMQTFCNAEPICNNSAIVAQAHPAHPQFLKTDNPLLRINEALRSLGVNKPIQWWPQVAEDAPVR